MQRESTGPILSTVFVDYDNIYLSLKRKNDEAAKRFSKDAALWLREIASGRLITSSGTYTPRRERRIVMTRCYGNPVPRKNAHDNSTDMNSFPFIRHHFLKSGFEVIDCPPLTAQLKNSADIKIVMDITDILQHDTYFDEVIIISGDADFTPLLHRLRAHARRTVVFANDYTAQPYTAISDGEVRESDLISLLIEGRLPSEDADAAIAALDQVPSLVDIESVRRSIVSEVITTVRSAPQPVPLEALADRAIRVLGHDKTVGSGWGGFGGFRDLLSALLPDDLILSDAPPYTVLDLSRHIGYAAPQRELQKPEPARVEQRRSSEPTRTIQAPAPAPQSNYQPAPAPRPAQPAAAAAPQQPRMSAPMPSAPAGATPRAPTQDQGVNRSVPPAASQPSASTTAAPELRRAPLPSAPGYQDARDERPAARQTPQQQTPPAQRNADQATAIQQSIAKIHEACQAPPLSPPEYRVLFDVMAQEITTNGLTGSQTLANIMQKAREFGVDLRRDDLRFILEVVSETDPWFEQGASASLFASRFRNFVVARCRSRGLNLSADELDLIEAWFTGTPQQPQQRAAQGQAQPAAKTPQPRPAAAQQTTDQFRPPVDQRNIPSPPETGDRWWAVEESRQSMIEQRGVPQYAAEESEDEFPRIVRSRFRG